MSEGLPNDPRPKWNPSWEAINHAMNSLEEEANRPVNLFDRLDWLDHRVKAAEIRADDYELAHNILEQESRRRFASIRRTCNRILLLSKSITEYLAVEAPPKTIETMETIIAHLNFIKEKALEGEFHDTP